MTSTRRRTLTGIVVAGICSLAFAGSASAATVNVTITTDELNADGDCSLREAVEATNINGPVSGCAHDGSTTDPDTIILQSSPYVLTLVGVNDDNTAGDLDISAGVGGLTIDGAVTGLNANGPDTGDRALHVEAGALDLEGVTIVNGAPAAAGGGILTQTDATLELLNSGAVLNVAAGAGGGINALGTGGVTLTNSMVSLNLANGGGGGGISHAAVAPLTITNSSIANNTAEAAVVSGGGVLFAPGGAATLTVTGSLIDENLVLATAQARGGGLATEGSSSAQSISSTVIEENDTVASGTGATSDSGGLFIGASTPMTVSDSLIQLNTSTVDDPGAVNHGGGVYNLGNSKIQRSTIFNNSLSEGVQSGGGIRGGGTLALVNSTVVNNLAPSGGGGGVRANGTATSIFNSTFSGNNALTGDALHRSAGTLSIRGSIIDNAVPADACAGGITSLGFNIDVGVSCDLGPPAMGDDEFIDPTLETFGDWGGPDIGPTGNTQPLTTQPPQLVSTAVEQFAGSGTTCQDEVAAPLATDERGFPRPFDGGFTATADCDAGAVEVYPCSDSNATQIGTGAGETINGGTGDDVIKGLGGNDTISGGTGADLVCGDDGNDTFDGSDTASADAFVGGNGITDTGPDDEVTYEDAAGDIGANLTTGATTNMTALDDVGPAGIENLRGGAGDNVFIGDVTNNDLRGGGGDDLLVGAAGNDLLDGGANTSDGDRTTYALTTLEAPGPVTASLLDGTASGHGTDMLLGLEDLRGGPFADTLTGDNGPNTVEGVGAFDTITGLGGMDDLQGEANGGSIFARDGVQDLVNCGGGPNDPAEVDQMGVDLVDPSCESVNFFVPLVIPPPSTTPPAATPTTPAAPKKCKKGRKLKKGKCVKKKKK